MACCAGVGCVSRLRVYRTLQVVSGELIAPPDPQRPLDITLCEGASPDRRAGAHRCVRVHMQSSLCRPLGKPSPSKKGTSKTEKHGGENPP